jgi:hypothetical protein
VASSLGRDSASCCVESTKLVTETYSYRVSVDEHSAGAICRLLRDRYHELAMHPMYDVYRTLREALGADGVEWDTPTRFED